MRQYKKVGITGNKEEIMRIITCSQHVIPRSPDLSHFVPINIINWYKLSTLYDLSYIELN